MCALEKSQPSAYGGQLWPVSRRKGRETGGDTGEMTRELGKGSCIKFAPTFLKAKRLSPVARAPLFWIRSLDKAAQCNLGMGWKVS